uniref:tRNA(Ile)-lysidine synthase n=1 Tax=Lygus hesperus TaxID=30085 RepID=A0A0A9VSB9_LYGHE
MNLKVCCIKLSLAARVIAMIGLITSVLVLTQLFSELVTENDGKGTVSILLGLDIDEFIQADSEGLELKIPFLFFALIYAVASSILIWGSIVEINYYAFPWLICEAVSFATQVATFTLICIKMGNQVGVDRWVILLSVCNLFLSIYFWIVVFCAQRTWARQRREERENMSTTTLSSGNDTIQDEVYEQPDVAPKKRLDITFDPSSLSAHPDKRIDIHFVD